MSLAGRHFVSAADCSRREWLDVLDLAARIKRGEAHFDSNGKVLGLIFSKPSTRTRASFSVAMARLGGQTLDLSPAFTQVGRGEPIKDTARVLSRYVDALAIRTFDQQDLEAYSAASSVPVINALTDAEHPCQAVADFLTVREHFPDLRNVTLAYVGDGNNVAHSLLLGGALLGVNIRVASPRGYEPEAAVINRAVQLSLGQCEIAVFNNPQTACQGAHVLYTDVWASMGQEEEGQRRRKDFAGYCLNDALLSLADPAAIVLHCLPAHRGEEISDAVLEGAASRVFDQAENRLHAQHALLALLLGLA